MTKSPRSSRPSSTVPRPRAPRRRTRGSTRTAARSGISSTASWRSLRRASTSRRVEPGATASARARSRRRGAADVDAAVPPRARALPGWQQARRATAARGTSTPSPAHIQKHARLFAVLETLDNGKPIRETRDIDIPLVARHFYHHAGWAQLMETRAARLRAGRRRRADHPVELPAADAGVEDRAGARHGQHGRAQARRVHAAHRAALRRDLRARPGCRRASSTSSPATAAPAQLIVEHPDIDKIAFTGSTEVGRIIREATAGTRQEALARAGRQVALHRLRRRRPRQRRSRAWSTRSGSTRARSAAPARASSCRRASREALLTTSCARAWRRCASAIRSTRRSTSARSSRRCSCEHIDALVQAGRRRRRDAVAAVLELPDGRLLLPADAVHRRLARGHDRAGRDLRPGAWWR